MIIKFVYILIFFIQLLLKYCYYQAFRIVIMGCTQSNNVLPPNVPPQHIARLIQVADVNHQLNVNIKYQYLTKLDQSSTTGEGLKKTFAYQCLTTRQELHAKRKQFWQTRNNGYPECWSALHSSVSCQADDQIMSLLSKVKVSPLNGSIQMCVDHKGNKYQLPVFVISEPISYQKQKIAEKNLIKNYERSDIKVKIRTVKFPNQDIILDANTQTSIQQIKTMIITKKQISCSSIRLFFSGRQMHDNKTLGNYGYAGEMIIQAMIKD